MARMNVLAEAVKGLKANIHAVDNLSPVSRFAVYIKAGSRYEPDEAPGISHYLKACAGITTLESSALGITRYMERNGASLKVTIDRDHIIYRIDCLRNKLGNVIRYVDDTIHKPEFRSWELVDLVKPKLTTEVASLKKNQEYVSNETLHKAAFRGGLAHSTMIPEHMISKIKKGDLMEFVEKNFVLSRMTFVGLGIDEEDLHDMIDREFTLNGNEYKGVSGATRYVGGEARIQADFPHTMMKFVVEGRPITDLRGQAILEIIGTILGDNEQVYVKYGSGSEKSLSNVLDPISPYLRSSIVNISHSDTGLFGICVIGPNDKMKVGTKKAIDHVRKVLSGITEADVKAAKNTLKSRSLISSENHDLVFANLCARFSNEIKGQSPLDHLEKITKKDVQEMGSKILKTKPTIVSIGNPRYVPYLDELDS